MERIWSIAVLAVLTLGLPGQVILQSGNPGWSGNNTQENVVRAADGTLWCLSVGDDGLGNRPLLLQFSTDGGANWATHPFVFNDASSGLSGGALTTESGLAIDDQGMLHAVWTKAQSSPAEYRTYYRRFDPASASPSAILDVTAHVGASASLAIDSTVVAVDAAGIVWITCKGTAANAQRLAYSNLPYASDLTFTRLGALFGTGSTGTSRRVHVAVDANGFVHCVFLDSSLVGTQGPWLHRYYDPATATWSAVTTVGNSSLPQDQFGDICADALGNLHAVQILDSGAGGTPTTVKMRYRKWDATNGWGPEITLSDIPLSNWTGIAGAQIFAIGCSEATGTVRVVFRDLANGGALELAELPLGGAGFAPVATLAPATLSQNAYAQPTIRGTLYPSSNNTASDWDVTWQYRAVNGTPPYDLYFQRVGSQPVVSLTLSAPAAIGTTTSVDLLSPADAGGSYVCGFALGNMPGITLPDSRVIPVNNDVLLLFSLTPGTGIFFNTLGILDGAGQASVAVVVPNISSLVNATVYAAFVVADPNDPTGIGTISPSLSITIN